MRPVEKLGHIFDRVNLILANAAAAILVLIGVAICINAVTRAFGASFSALLEISEFSLLWITFLGTAWLLRKGGHVSIDIVPSRLSPRGAALLDVITCCVSILLFALITWYSAKITLQHFQTNYLIGTTILREPKAPIEIIIPIGCFLLFIELFRKTYGRLADWQTLSRR